MLAEKNTFDWGLARYVRSIAFIAAGKIFAALPFMKQELSALRDQGESSWLDALLAYCGVIFAGQGKHEWAVELTALGLTNPQYGGGLGADLLLTRTRAELKEALDEERFAAAWERGKKLDPLAAAGDVLAALESLEAAA